MIRRYFPKDTDFSLVIEKNYGWNYKELIIYLGKLIIKNSMCDFNRKY